MSNQPLTAPEPRAGEVWREADGTLLLCYEPGNVWVHITTMLIVSAADPDLVQPMTLVVHTDGTPAAPAAA